MRFLVPVLCCAATMVVAQTDDTVSVTYVCERGVEVPVIYVNSATDTSYAVAQIDGKMVGMHIVISGSGARYRSGDGADAYQLWSKGDTALISYGPDGNDTPLFTECAAQG